MKFYHIFTFLSLIIAHNQVNAINLKTLFYAGLFTTQAQSDCRVYNPTNKDITIQNKKYNLINMFIKDSFTELSQTTIPANNFEDISYCIHLEIIADETTDYKAIELENDYQPHGHTRAFTLQENPCYKDCQGIMTQIELTPGLPKKYTAGLSSLTIEEVTFLTQQLEHNPETITNACKDPKKRHLK